MDVEFEDIRIVDLDLAKTTWSRVHDSLRVMYLRLDRHPPDVDWGRLFFEERETRIVARRRGLWLEDNYISFDSLPAEVEKIHIPDIRLSVAYANRKYRELCWQRRLKRLEEQAGRRSEQDEMQALQQRVRSLLEPESPTAPLAGRVVKVAGSTADSRAVSVGRSAAAAASTPAIPDTVAEPALPAAPAAAPSDPLAEFERRRDALKQQFRLAAAQQDKEQK
ncbi:hypothetical protein DFR29_11897 [Tahibacter aquaticus]|uniref:Uncharacterized protein n=1 Tax=Tahibacter aquaticus TaxID=520092 RepID=A0A4R6YN20_9GAMM|nr:hypothetical protein [Tahibacter aquaticus]TDR38954.1 hypothetical protein DFR29_11897 [Tahibacter aquaticus]